jgi:hypothetical protein
LLHVSGNGDTCATVAAGRLASGGCQVFEWRLVEAETPSAPKVFTLEQISFFDTSRSLYITTMKVQAPLHAHAALTVARRE